MLVRPSIKKSVAIAALLVVTPSFAPAAEAETLERGLVDQAPALIKHFKAKKYANVGVLKFLIAREGEKSKGLSDNVGTLNMLLARRLEVALVLANDPKAPVGIIRNASAVAARTRGANHRNPTGRKKLFEPDYRLAWGKANVKADAFVTGTAQVSKDLGKLTVSLFAFDRATNKLAQVGEDFEVRSDAGKLAEMNESFALRGLFDDGQVIHQARRVKQGLTTHPLRQNDLPVRLEVLYDNRPVPVEYRDGKAFVPEPQRGQKVAFRLRRDSSKVRYGAVLKVNGENTVGRQRLPDLQCRRWILDPGDRPILVGGFQMGSSKAQQFVVLSRAESKAREIDYGADVGTITLTVFQERQKEEVADAGEEKARQKARVVARARLPQKEDYATLKQELLDEANETRGLVVAGKEELSRVREVKFTPDPTPVMSVTLIYYRPGRD
jgi:hypothetical protein